MKTCTVCGQSKPESDYRLHSDKKTVMGYCNDCHLAKRRAQHAAKREERNAQFRARYAANANGVRDKHAAARKMKYTEEGRAALVAWIAANPEKAAEAQRKKMKRGSERLAAIARFRDAPGRDAILESVRLALAKRQSAGPKSTTD